jgi:hypothetical protein
MPEKPDPTFVERPKPFNQILAQLEAGVLHEELSEKVRDLTAWMSEFAAQRGSAKGSLTLRLDFAMEKGLVVIKGEVSAKTPKLDREQTVMWLTPGNNLSNENPKQQPLFPRKLPEPSRRSMLGPTSSRQGRSDE